MSEKEYILLIAEKSEASPLSISSSNVISLQSLIFSYQREYDKERKTYLKELFGESLFSYQNCNIFQTINGGGAEKFVEQAFNGHMSSGKDIMPFLYRFVLEDQQATHIRKTYESLKCFYQTYSDEELQEKCKRIKTTISLWKENLSQYSSLGILFPSTIAENVLCSVEQICNDVGYEPFCKTLTALGYFAICFLSLTETAYSKRLSAKESESRTFKAVQSALPKLLKSIKVFLEEPVSKSKPDRKETAPDKNGEDHPNFSTVKPRRKHTGFSQEMIDKIEEYVFYNMAEWLKKSLTTTQFESALRSFLQELYEDGILDIDYIEYAQNYGSHYYSLFHAVLECLKDLGRGYAKDLVEQYSKRLEQYEKTFAEEKFKESTKSNNNEENYERN